MDDTETALENSKVARDRSYECLRVVKRLLAHLLDAQKRGDISLTHDQLVELVELRTVCDRC